MVRSAIELGYRSVKKPKLIADSLGYDFAVLGLKAHESRIHVIRKAAIETAHRIQDESDCESEQGEMLSQLAASTYRLLDPRRRPSTSERVQLCLHSEEDLELQKQSRRTLIPSRI
ncbi:MAG: hypothetical protein VXZ82_11400 [Planctomycetota bacterium]|nr:hypothetical protein [Planctomycetota bacterium]